jgi:hypothetical protein
VSIQLEQAVAAVERLHHDAPGRALETGPVDDRRKIGTELLNGVGGPGWHDGRMRLAAPDHKEHERDGAT